MGGLACTDCNGVGFDPTTGVACSTCNEGAPRRSPRPQHSPKYNKAGKKIPEPVRPIRERIYDGNPMAERDRSTRQAAFRSKYIDASLGDIIMLMCEAGWDEDTAARVICAEFDQAYLRGDGSASKRSWVELGLQLLKQSGDEKRAAKAAASEVE